MKKTLLFLALFALLPMLIVGCNPPQNKNAQKKTDDGTCDCGHDHGAEGHADDAGKTAVEPTPPVTPDEPVVEPETPVTPDEPVVEPEPPVTPDVPVVEPEPPVTPDEPVVEPETLETTGANPSLGGGRVFPPPAEPEPAE